ncbi:hypothetical protein FHC77_08325 [Atlantibacter hermannii]|uniref:glucosyltransferase domain-containing protein n=1 Tax=Atlantibacter hermannii TaxID=565 RepID=UPI001C6FEA66|nr:glucosyltransferase domain-containing protein [Atlantibacter hermannii]MBW9430749.1 hypothetical protein [Atlantibacter hermannii]
MNKKIYCYLLLTIGVFLLPIILANVYYIDDYTRVMRSVTDWDINGRPLANAIILSLGANNNLMDASPLPMLLSIIVLSTGSYFSFVKIFPNKKLTNLVLFLPVIFNPFFLENASFKFDVISMALSYAIAFTLPCFEISSWKKSLSIGVAAVISILCLYQPTINTYLSMSVIILFRDILTGDKMAQSIKAMALKTLSFIIGCALYYSIIAQIFVSGDYSETHSTVIPFDGNILHNIYKNFLASASFIRWSSDGFFGYIYGLIIISTIAIIAWLCLTKVISLKKALVLNFCLIMAIALIPGTLLLLQNQIIRPRVFTSYTIPLLLLSILVYKFNLNAFKVIIYAYCFSIASLSYSYGNAIKAQFNFNDFLFSWISNDISYFAHGNLNAEIYLTGKLPLPIQTYNATLHSNMISSLVPQYNGDDFTVQDIAFSYFKDYKYMTKSLKGHEVNECNELVISKPWYLVYECNGNYIVKFKG